MNHRNHVSKATELSLFYKTNDTHIMSEIALIFSPSQMKRRYILTRCAWLFTEQQKLQNRRYSIPCWACVVAVIFYYTFFIFCSPVDVGYQFHRHLGKQ